MNSLLGYGRYRSSDLKVVRPIHSFTCLFRDAPSQCCVARTWRQPLYRTFVRNSWIVECYGHLSLIKWSRQWDARCGKWVHFPFKHFLADYFLSIPHLWQGTYRVIDGQFDLSLLRRIPIDPEKLNVNLTLYEYVTDAKSHRNIIKRQLVCLEVKVTITLSKNSNFTRLRSPASVARPRN